MGYTLVLPGEANWVFFIFHCLGKQENASENSLLCLVVIGRTAKSCICISENFSMKTVYLQLFRYENHTILYQYLILYYV